MYLDLIALLSKIAGLSYSYIAASSLAVLLECSVRMMFAFIHEWVMNDVDKKETTQTLFHLPLSRLSSVLISSYGNYLIQT